MKGEGGDVMVCVSERGEGGEELAQQVGVADKSFFSMTIMRSLPNRRTALGRICLKALTTRSFSRLAAASRKTAVLSLLEYHIRSPYFSNV